MLQSLICFVTMIGLYSCVHRYNQKPHRSAFLLHIFVYTQKLIYVALILIQAYKYPCTILDCAIL